MDEYRGLDSVIDYDLWMERISAVIISDSFAENIRCLYENDDIMVVHQITNAPNGTRDAVMYVFTKENGMLTKLETETTPLPPKK
jgi:hypothetical protein